MCDGTGQARVHLQLMTVSPSVWFSTTNWLPAAVRLQAADVYVYLESYDKYTEHLEGLQR